MHAYIPISCSAYDVLEAAAVKRSPLRLATRSDAGRAARDVYVLDLFAREKVEYALFQDAATHEEFVLRLDEIERITDLNSNVVYSPKSCPSHSNHEDDL
jgi:transcriptional antiterminator Rof (Rho-off)